MSLYPRKRTWISTVVMSAKGHNRTHAALQIAGLFDHLIGAGKQRGWHGNAEGPRSAQVY